MVKSPMEQRIIDALETLAAEHGVDIVDVEMAGATKAPCVRVRLEGADGEALGLDDIAAQTKWVSDAVEAIDPVAGSYTLEVSSPGMARPLRRPRDFARFTGEDVDLVTTATEGRRKFTRYLRVGDRGGRHARARGRRDRNHPLCRVKKCTLKPVFDFKGGAKKEGKN